MTTLALVSKTLISKALTAKTLSAHSLASKALTSEALTAKALTAKALTGPLSAAEGVEASYLLQLGCRAALIVSIARRRIPLISAGLNFVRQGRQRFRDDSRIDVLERDHLDRPARRLGRFVKRFDDSFNLPEQLIASINHEVVGPNVWKNAQLNTLLLLIAAPHHHHGERIAPAESAAKSTASSTASLLLLLRSTSFLAKQAGHGVGDVLHVGVFDFNSKGHPRSLSTFPLCSSCPPVCWDRWRYCARRTG